MLLDKYRNLFSEIPESREPETYGFYVLSVYGLGMGFLMHVVFMGIFAYLHVWIMAWVNVGSCLLYALGFFLNEKGRHPVVLVIFCSEILLHSILASLFVGGVSGFHLYILLLGLSLFLYYRLSLAWKIAFGTAIMTVYFLLGSHLQANPPWADLPLSTIIVLQYMNLFFIFAALANMGLYYSKASVGFAKALNLRLSEVNQKNRIIENRQKQMEDDLALAMNIQMNILPAKVPVSTDLAFSTAYLPAEKLGGDIFDFIRFPDGHRTGIFISDISGHGVPAALIVSMIKILVSTAGETASSPASLLEYINRQVRGLTADHFVTVFYGIYDNRDRSFKYARAAHNYPYLLRTDGSRPGQLKSRGPLLGIFEKVSCEEKTVSLGPGDKIILYTDGLTEATDTNGEYFEGKLERLLEEESGKPIKALADSITSELKRFLGDRTPVDDICLVGMEVLRSKS